MSSVMRSRASALPRAGLALAAMLGAGFGGQPEHRPASDTIALPILVAVDTSLEGRFVWLAVDGRSAPAEFPPGSGVMLIGGSLALRDLAGARAGTGGRFGLRFTVRSGADSVARTSGEDGRFQIAGDSLQFTPDGRENRPPVRFRYGWKADGTLALTDTQGHIWTYRREQ
ncbi:MAG TPA: hypothetical protein VFO95_07380 [Gemmatimonadales bacterium]|nr:hypothetical protein [Gemmatimonadales bacterium]